MKYLEGKVVLLTDLDPGVGAGVTDRLLQAGASVLVTGFRAAEVISSRFARQQAITNTGFDEVTTSGIMELESRIQQDYGCLDVIYMNNDVHPSLSSDEILLKHATGFSFALQKLHPLLRDGSTIVVCSSFSPEQRRRSKSTIDATTVFMQSSAKYWALALEARRIRVNVISLYESNHEHLVQSENLDLSSARTPLKSRTRPNSVKEVASAIADLVDDNCMVSGVEVAVVDGKPEVTQLPFAAESEVLGTTEQVVDNVIFLASDLSRPLTGIELFPGGEIRKL